MRRLSNPKTRIVLMVTIALLFAITSLLYGAQSWAKGEILPATIIPFIAIIIAIAFIVYAVREIKNIKKGLPSIDERSRKVKFYSAGYAFIISIYFVLAISWLDEPLTKRLGHPLFRDVSQALGLVIAGMAIIWGLCYLYMNRKENI